MRSRIKTGEGVESQLVAPTTGVLQPRKRFDQNYGAMTMVMGYLTPIEQLRMQGLDTWQYNTGVGRVQVRLKWKMFYFVDQKHSILAVSESGECQRFECRGESSFSNKDWISCQVGRSRLFQFTGSSFRILRIYPSQRSFTVERQQASPLKEAIMCLTNFQDQFIFFFFFRWGLPRRYSLAEDRWEELPPPKDCVTRSACSLGDKVYAFASTKSVEQNFIHVLHNPGASISSQELHWGQVIEVPENIVTPRFVGGFVPLNSTEIAILGGLHPKYRHLRDVITFNTCTCELKKEMENRTFSFVCQQNQSAKVCENTIIALVTDTYNQKCLIKYKKGDTCFTQIQMPASTLSDSDDDDDY